MEEIAKQINLDYDDMQKDRNSAAHLYYKSKFIFDHGNYDAHKLLVLGFLLCKHIDIQKAGDSFWGILNPEIKETVNRDKVRTFLNLVCDVAIDLA